MISSFKQTLMTCKMTIDDVQENAYYYINKRLPGIEGLLFQPLDILRLAFELSDGAHCQTVIKRYNGYFTIDLFKQHTCLYRISLNHVNKKIFFMITANKCTTNRELVINILEKRHTLFLSNDNKEHEHLIYNLKYNPHNCKRVRDVLITLESLT